MFRKEKIGSRKNKKGAELTPIPLSEYAQSWFHNEYSHRVRPATRRINHYYLDKHVLPYFNGKLLHEITEIDIEELKVRKEQEGYTLATIRGLFSFLSALFQSAIVKGYIEENPMSGKVKRIIGVPNRFFEPWSKEEIDQFLNVAISEGEGVMYYLELSTGLRLLELLALSWEDIDFEQGTVIVKRNLSLGGNGKMQIEKIRSSLRTLVLPPHLLPLLEKHKEQQQVMKEQFGEKYNELNLVFPKDNGEIQNPSTVRAKFNRLIEKSKVKRIAFHDLREMNAILLYRAGISLYYVKEILGYKRVDTVINFLGPHLLKTNGEYKG